MPIVIECKSFFNIFKPKVILPTPNLINSTPNLINSTPNLINSTPKVSYFDIDPNQYP
jgi:hypothetical protein